MEDHQMQTKSLLVLGLCAVVLCPAVLAQSQAAAANSDTRGGIYWARPYVPADAEHPAAAPALATVSATSGNDRSLDISTHSFPADVFSPLRSLPFWKFDVKASRDGQHHLGAMVGHDPFKHPGTDRIPTYIVPVIF